MLIDHNAASSSGKPPIVQTGERRIPCEIWNHFTGMTCYRRLRDGKGATLSSLPYARKRRRGLRCEKEVRVVSCTSRVLSCIPCEVLKECCVLWAESTVVVVVRDVFASHAERRRRKGEDKEDGNIKTRRSRHVKENIVVGGGEGDHYELTFLSLHIVYEAAYTSPLKYSFALQSICQPGGAVQPECYPHHMLHFGLLMYLLWQIPERGLGRAREEEEEEQAKEGERKRPKKMRRKNLSSEKDSKTSNAAAKSNCSIPSTSSSTNSSSLSSSSSQQQFPFSSPTVGDVSVLILGLGGNVLGNCLDASLSFEVPIDVVEVEPAVLKTCWKHKQIPPCMEAHNQQGEPLNNVWIVERGSRRHPHYRFIAGDARDLLQAEGDQMNDGRGALRNQFYALIFLDCYDPQKECMMHDGGLIDRCRSRLSPGGALIVNAHILPTREALEEQFLSRGFASVQVLRVAGCDQSIVVCLAGHSESESSTNNNVQREEEGVNHRRDGEQTRVGRFSVLHARQLVRKIQNTMKSSSDTSCLFRGGFCVDASLLKSSRLMEGTSCHTRVWEHYD